MRQRQAPASQPHKKKEQPAERQAPASPAAAPPPGAALGDVERKRRAAERLLGARAETARSRVAAGETAAAVARSLGVDRRVVSALGGVAAARALGGLELDGASFAAYQQALAASLPPKVRARLIVRMAKQSDDLASARWALQRIDEVSGFVAPKQEASTAPLWATDAGQETPTVHVATPTVQVDGSNRDPLAGSPGGAGETAPPQAHHSPSLQAHHSPPASDAKPNNTPDVLKSGTGTGTGKGIVH